MTCCKTVKVSHLNQRWLYTYFMLVMGHCPVITCVHHASAYFLSIELFTCFIMLLQLGIIDVIDSRI